MLIPVHTYKTNVRYLKTNGLLVAILKRAEVDLFAHNYEVHTISFQTFFVWALLLIVHT